MLGSSSATAGRCPPGGDLAFVPPYDPSLLLDTDFLSSLPLIPPAPPSRQKGWRAFPIRTPKSASGLVVQKEAATVLLGYGLDDATFGVAIEAGSRAVLAQEIRNARGGHYTFTVKVTGLGTSVEEFEKTFLANVTCRLILFRFRDTKKDTRSVDELESAVFAPSFAKSELFKVSRFLGSSIPGTNFPIGNGLGVAIAIEKKTPGSLTLPKDESHWAALRIESVEIDFSPRLRDENVVQ